MVTERRLKALEGDLQRAELARKERTLAIRYHKIKFFGKIVDFDIIYAFLTNAQNVKRLFARLIKQRNGWHPPTAIRIHLKLPCLILELISTIYWYVKNSIRSEKG